MNTETTVQEQLRNVQVLFHWEMNFHVFLWLDFLRLGLFVCW